MNLSNNNDKKSKKSGIASLFGRGSVSKIGKSQFPKSMGGIVERLKGLSRKDLALVGVGLSVLVAAPVAEYMISKPADSANMLTSGFSSRDAQGASALASLYEPGINALSQGSADGSGEVITPLSARDPYALILGAQPEQPAMPDYSSMSSGYSDSGAASSSSSSTGSSDYNDLRDSVKDSAKRGAAKAVQNAGTPTVIKSMPSKWGNGAGRGGGGSSTKGMVSMSAPQKANVGAKQSKLVNPVSSNGFKGATNTPNSVDSSAADRLRAKANAQGGYFSGASAVKSADAANAIKMNDKLVDGSTGSSYDGTGYGNGKGWKDPSPKSSDNRFNRGSFECKTLTCEAAKKRQEAALKWENFLKYDIPTKIVDAVVKTGTDLIGKTAEKLVAAYLWNEDVDGITMYYCMKGCEIKDKTKKLKTRDSWKACDDIVTRSEYEKYYRKKHGCGPAPKEDSPKDDPKPNNGNQKPGGDQGGNTVWNQKPYVQTPDAEFEKYVKNYDEGLKKFMAEMALVIKNSESEKGISYAKSSVNIYTDYNREGSGFGFPFDNLNLYISKTVVPARQNDIKKNNTLIKATQDSLSKEKSAGSDFLAKLSDIKNNPEKYQKAQIAADGNKIVTHISETTKAAIEEKFRSYKESYDLMINYKDGIKPYALRLKDYENANNVLETYTKQTSKVVSSVYSQYSGEYVSKVNGYIQGSDQWKQELKKNITVFTNKMYGAEVLSTELTKLTADSNDSLLASAIPMHGRILLAVADVPQVKGGSPAGKARSWRGFPHNFGTDIKNVSAGSKDLETRYSEQAKQTILDEEKSWKADCPLEIGADNKLGEPKDNIEAKSSLKTDQFYAASYRAVYEIKAAVRKLGEGVENINKHISEVSKKRAEIINWLASIDIQMEEQQGNTNTSENQGNTQTEVKYDNCVQGKNCSYSQVKKLEKQAAAHGHYSSASTAEIWNGDWLYRDLRPEWQNDAKVGSDYNTHAVKAHNLRSYIDDLAVKYESATDSDTKKMYKEKIDSSKNSLKEEINATNEAWKKICVSHNENNPSRCKTNMFDVPPNNTSGNNAGSGNANTGNPATGNNGDANNGTSGNNAGSGPLIGNEIKPGPQIGNEIEPAAQINPSITRGGAHHADQAKSAEAKKHPRNDKRNPRNVSMKLTSNKTISGSYDGYNITVAEMANKPNTYYGKAVRETDNKEFRIHFSCNDQNKVISPVIVHIPGGEKMFKIDGNVPCESN